MSYSVFVVSLPLTKHCNSQKMLSPFWFDWHLKASLLVAWRRSGVFAHHANRLCFRMLIFDESAAAAGDGTTYLTLTSRGFMCPPMASMQYMSREHVYFRTKTALSNARILLCQTGLHKKMSVILQPLVKRNIFPASDCRFSCMALRLL
jgi:hypothetical protein